MISNLAVLYLFLGGAGAGCVAVCCVLDLLLVKQPFGCSAYLPGLSETPCERTIDYSFAAAFGFLVVGIVCLLADLGRIDRVLALFLHPHATAMTVGSYALVGIVLVAFFLAAVRCLYLPSVSRNIVVIIECVAIVFAVLVMSYTGVLLQSLSGVPFWKTPLIPVLFTLSSFSCGAAVVFVMAVFSGHEESRQLLMIEYLARFDAVIIVLELVCAAVLLLQAASSSNPATVVSLLSITNGATAAVWWLGFIVCGALIPFCVELFVGRIISVRTTLSIVALFILLGAACMRWAVVESGTYGVMSLHDVPVQEATVEEWGMV